VKVLLVNLSHDPFEIRRGMRIAQMVIARVVSPELRAVFSVADTGRGGGGFGSTGSGGA
jgi:dUTP pyrophosphatase